MTPLSELGTLCLSLKYQGDSKLPTLKYYRERAGLTAVELAVATHVSPATINRLERGKPGVSRTKAYKVLNFLSERLGQRIELEEIEPEPVENEHGG